MGFEERRGILGNDSKIQLKKFIQARIVGRGYEKEVMEETSSAHY